MPFDSQWLLKSAQKLVRIPSRGGVDSPDAVVAAAKGLAEELGLPCEVVSEEGRPLGLWVRTCDKPAKEKIALIACIDTSGFDEAIWRNSPTDPVVQDGWLYGRGSTDSKAMACLFLLLARELKQKQIPVEIFLDADEHTGHFSGTRAFSKVCQGLTGGYIGYPGADAVNRGARGFYRVRIRCEGKEGHTGSTARPNAIQTAAKLAQEFSSSFFDLTPRWENRKPQWTVTAIRGGGDWGRVPEQCEIDVDIRLTKAWDKEAAQKALESIFEKLEIRQQVVVEEIVGAPPYSISEDSPLVSELVKAAQSQGMAQIGSKVCGPSNVGNFFAEYNIPMICGWGPRYKNMHAPNECVCLEDFAKVYEVYYQVLEKLISD